MILKSTLGSLSSATAVLVFSVWGWTSLNDNHPGEGYTPRPVEASQSPDGAFDIRRMLVGDAEVNNGL